MRCYLAIVSPHLATHCVFDPFPELPCRRHPARTPPMAGHAALIQWWPVAWLVPMTNPHFTLLVFSLKLLLVSILIALRSRCPVSSTSPATREDSPPELDPSRDLTADPGTPPSNLISAPDLSDAGSLRSSAVFRSPRRQPLPSLRFPHQPDAHEVLNVSCQSAHGCVVLQDQRTKRDIEFMYLDARFP
jgi:hypothetical protein